MDTKMTFGGIGPKLALLCLPYIILSMAIIFRYPEFLDMKFLDTQLFRIAGFIWLGAGIGFWFWSAVHFLIHFKSGKLITNGPFRISRNPIYSSMILFNIPALGILFHSGLILSIALVLYIGFRISIHGETNILKRNFGQEYDEYEKSVNEIFPFPRYLFRRSGG